MKVSVAIFVSLSLFLGGGEALGKPVEVGEQAKPTSISGEQVNVASKRKVSPNTKLKKNPNEWKKVVEDTKLNLTVWNREVPNSKVREVKAEATLDFEVGAVWKVIDDIDSYTEFMPYIEKIEVVSESDNEIIAYHKLDMPWPISDRDYTLRIESQPQPSKGTYFRKWKVEGDNQRAKSDDYVRLETCDGYWMLKAIGPNTTKVVYWLYTDPGGSVPSWAANKANSESLPELFEAIKQRVIDPSYQRN